MELTFNDSDESMNEREDDPKPSEDVDNIDLNEPDEDGHEPSQADDIGSSEFESDSEPSPDDNIGSSESESDSEPSADDDIGSSESESDSESSADDDMGWEETSYEPEYAKANPEPDDDQGWEEKYRRYEQSLNQRYRPRIFDQYYLCLPISDNMDHLEDGNKIIMPASALGRLMDMRIEFPMVFEIENVGLEGCVSHCGVMEFSAEEGFVYLPNWMMKNLKLSEGDLVNFKNVILPKGEFMKIQPHETKFVMNLHDPKDVLEVALKKFACVSSGDTIVISHEGQKYSIDIVETKPYNAISLFETDCEVDFAPPLDYKEPEKESASVIKWKNEESEKVQEKSTFKAFIGEGRRMDDQTVAKTEYNASSSLKVEENQVKMGKKVDVEDKNSNADVKKFQPFTGMKNTLEDS